MSIASDGNGDGSDGGGGGGRRDKFVRRNMARVPSNNNSPEVDRSAAVREDHSSSHSSRSSSSIGKNSDECREGGGGEEEVQSERKKGPLDCLQALEEVLPIKRGLSNFYCGKSKSFASLPDAESCSMQDLAKPENAYSRKRKNLVAMNYFWDKDHDSSLGRGTDAISKKRTTSRSMMSLAANMNSSESAGSETSNSSSPGCVLPPLPPQSRKAINSELSSSPPAAKFPSWGAMSLSDLQGASAAAAATPSITGLRTNDNKK